MQSYKGVFVIGTGSFLPGDPIDNNAIDQFIKPINAKSSRIKNLILKENGIQTRHYGINQDGESRLSLAEMTAFAARQALENARIELKDIECLTAGTTAADIIAPGFANMIQGELSAQPMETSSHSGICASGIAALRYAADGIELGRYKHALVCAGEFPSRLFKASRFAGGYDLDFDSHFLRWMLSDGAGSLILSSRPSETRPSLMLTNIHLRSFSGDFSTCMHLGSSIENQKKGFYDYASFSEAEQAGSLFLRQNIRMLPQLFEVCLHEYALMVKNKVINPSEISHFVCHYSSEKFAGVMEDLLIKADLMIPREKWFSNLKSKGNMGAASIFVMLDDLIKERNPKVGEKILCFIPESGRFSVGYILFEMVESNSDSSRQLASSNRVQAPAIEYTDSKSDTPQKIKEILLDLSDVWHEFRSNLWRTNFFSKISRNRITMKDYIQWIENWIPQVRQGSVWMRTAAKNFRAPYLKEISDIIEIHASEEQNDWKILFDDYKAAGGEVSDPDLLKLNSGGAALSQFMFERANSNDAIDLLGGIYIIEGSGQRIIPFVLPVIKQQLKTTSDCFRFLQYHGTNDEHHILRWLSALNLAVENDASGQVGKKIIETAQTVAKLYCRQMEELN